MNTDEVKKIAKLAKLDLSEPEIEKIKSQFAAILDHIKKIDELDLSGVEPVSHPFNITNVFREDKPQDSMSALELMKIAPHHGRDMVRVPRIIEK